MPDIPAAERGRLLAAAARAAWAVDNAFRGTLGAAAAVIAVAAALQLSGIRPEYVAAAAVVVFIRKFADKRYGSNIRVEQPPAKERTYRHEDVAALDALQ